MFIEGDRGLSMTTISASFTIEYFLFQLAAPVMAIVDIGTIYINDFATFHKLFSAAGQISASQPSTDIDMPAKTLQACFSA